MTQLEKKMHEEGKFFFEIWRDSMKDTRHLAIGNSSGLEWEDLAEEVQTAWIEVADRAHDRYWA